MKVEIDPPITHESSRLTASPAVQLSHITPRSGRRATPKIWLGIADLASVTLAISAAWITRRYLSSWLSPGEATATLLLGLASLPVWLALFIRYRLYSSRFVTRSLDEVRRIVNAATAGTVSIAVLGYATKTYSSRAWFVIVWLFAVALLTIERGIARGVFSHLRRKGRMLRRVVIVGCNNEGREIARMFAGDPSLGYSVVGFVDDCDQHLGAEIAGEPPLLGSFEETKQIVVRCEASGVIIAATAMKLETSNRVIRDLTRAGIHVELSSTMRDIAAARLTIRPLGRFPVVYVEPVERGGWRSTAKRAFDVVAAACLIVVMLPVLVIAALLIRLDSPGSVMFRQIRIGRDGRPFHLYKLRTMVHDAEAQLIDLRSQNELDGPLFKIRNDPRVTRVGRALRRTSIDELPQLWNVLRGEMSLVGPRPALPREIADWSIELHERLRVRPGITGMWQVNGRNSVSFREYERLDLYYVDNWSLVNDLVILAKTIPSVISRRGAF
ncbi:MAG TPA: sugar transferase [Acidimicrobiales bacterium]|jgi:exopolysaccharide biosynthesis polyprenyl glycosylphosphotransferase|nr:sugar transferase [Acidimicrobiales bacterium]